MLDRFNFYDIFGYFVPGCVCLAALFLPFGLVADKWPSSDLASALAAVLLAYLVGHYLQAIGSSALPSSKNGRLRSSVMLDQNDRSLASAFRSSIVRVAKAQLDLDLTATEGSTKEELDGLRDAAFFAAREQLIAADRSRYLEQFQALYSMMRGNFVAAIIGAAYVMGWIASNRSIAAMAVWLLVPLAGVHLFSLVGPRTSSLSSRERLERERKWSLWSLGSLLLLAVVAGAVLGADTISDARDRQTLLALLIGLMALGAQSWRRYGFYADEFAKSVYRGFIQLHLHPLPKKVE